MALAVIVLLYIFVCGIKLMGTGCKALVDANDPDNFASKLIKQAGNIGVAIVAVESNFIIQHLQLMRR